MARAAYGAGPWKFGFARAADGTGVAFGSAMPFSASRAAPGADSSAIGGSACVRARGHGFMLHAKGRARW